MNVISDTGALDCQEHDGTLSSITYPTAETNTFAYNGEDARVSRTDSGGTRTYKRDGSGVTDSVLSDGAANYTPGLSERRSGATKYVHQDHLGTHRRLTDSTQATTDTRQYDAFGLLVSSTGSTPSPFGFAGAHGYQEDADSGLKLLGHRYYEASTGRFLTRDPRQAGKGGGFGTHPLPAAPSSRRPSPAPQGREAAERPPSMRRSR